jgi:clan AA aspartic protease (TIGR02281 family)
VKVFPFLFLVAFPLMAVGGENNKCMHDGKVIHPMDPCSPDSVALETSLPRAKPNSVSVLIDDYGHYILPGRINGTPVDVVIDTGASSTVISKKFATRAGISSCVDAGSGSTANGRINVCETRVSTLFLDKFQFGDVRVGILPDLGSASVLVGNDLLSRLKIEVQNGVMTLTR